MKYRQYWYSIQFFYAKLNAQRWRNFVSDSLLLKLSNYSSTSKKHSQSILIKVTNMLAPSTNSQVSIRKGLLTVLGHFLQRPLHTKYCRKIRENLLSIIELNWQHTVCYIIDCCNSNFWKLRLIEYLIYTTYSKIKNNTYLILFTYIIIQSLWTK